MKTNVVLCKECKWFRICETEDFETYLDCDHPDGGGIPRSEEWYCADGEKEMPTILCDTCRYNKLDWCLDLCEGCVAGIDKPSHYKSKSDKPYFILNALNIWDYFVKTKKVAIIK